MDDVDREKFYSPPGTDDDDGELELEPLDPEVVAGQERRTREAIEASRTSINIDDIYRDVEQDRGREILEGWVKKIDLKKFRFQVKHLLIGTAVLAILLTLAKLGIFWPVLVIAFMLSIGGIFMYVQWEEKKHQEEADRRRQAMYAERRRKLMQQSGGTAGEVVVERATTPVPLPPLPNEVDEIWKEATAQERFRFQFSLKQLVLAVTAAALILGFTRWLGGPAPTATMLGVLALAGLVIHATGFQPPEIVVLGWWLILVLYVVLSVFAAVFHGFG